MSTQAYPLQWPDGWPRTPEDDRQFGRFGKRKTADWNSNYTTKKDITISEALKRINDELEVMDGPGRQWNRIKGIVISTNLKVRKSDGEPASNQRSPDDPGAALYFEMDGVRQSVPCDTYTKVAQNLAGIAATIYALRALKRHGSGLMERAFTGFEALPDPNKLDWWTVLGVDIDAYHSQVLEAYKTKRSETHPDKPGGSHELFIAVNEAWKQYQEQSNG